MRKFLWAIALQSLSPALQFGLVVLIAQKWGLDVQGYYASKKALLDLLVTAGLFGLPQSIVLAINRDSTDRAALYRNAWFYGVGLFLLFLVITTFPFVKKYLESILWVFALSVASSMIVVNNLLRGILLTVNDGLRFHLITVVPATSIVTAVVFALSFGYGDLSVSLAYAFMVTGVLVLLQTLIIFPPKLVHGFSGHTPFYRRIFIEGLDVFFQSTLMSLQTYIALSWSVKSMGLAQAGYVSIGLLLFQSLLLPLQFVAPLVLNQWSRATPPSLFAFLGKFKWHALVVSPIFGGLIVAGSWWLPRIFGAEIKGGVSALQIFMLAALPGGMARVGSLRLMALRRFRRNALLAALRLAIFALTLMAVPPQLTTAFPLAIAWLFSEVATLMGYLLPQELESRKREEPR
jgi:O-antigen/teichoic acid export membrane protein